MYFYSQIYALETRAHSKWGHRNKRREGRIFILNSGVQCLWCAQDYFLLIGHLKFSKSWEKFYLFLIAYSHLSKWTSFLKWANMFTHLRKKLSEQTFSHTFSNEHECLLILKLQYLFQMYVKVSPQLMNSETSIFVVAIGEPQLCQIIFWNH